MTEHPILSRHVGAGVRLGLGRVRELLDYLGRPQLAVPVIHVAGTNGKGSVCHMAAEMLRAEGLRVGLTISPHLQRYNERIRIDGADLADGPLEALLCEVDDAATRWARQRGITDEGTPLTLFELLAVAAFVAFAREKLDVAVVEVGLGGRLDATNVVVPEVCAITTVDLDHCDKLGPDIPSIAAEKAGIFKEGAHAVVGRLHREALSVARSMAAERGCSLAVLGEQFKVEGPSPAFTWRFGERVIEALALGLDGVHQIDNAAVALACVHLLGQRKPGLFVGEEAMRDGLARARNPGRCEWLAPGLLVDGAHNAAGAGQLAAYLRTLPRDAPRTLLLGASDDKDVRSIGAVLAPEVDRVYTTACAHPRAMKPGEVARALVGLGVPVLPAGPVEDALPAALERGGLVVVAGSLFLVGAVRELRGFS